MTILKHNTPSAEAKSPCNIFESISKRGRKKLKTARNAALGLGALLGLLGAEQAVAGPGEIEFNSAVPIFEGYCTHGGEEVGGTKHNDGYWYGSGPRGGGSDRDPHNLVNKLCPDAPSSTSSASSGVESKKNRQELLAMVESRLLQGKRLGLTADQVLESIAKENGDDSWIFINKEKGCPRTREESAEIMLQIGWSFDEVRKFLRICGEKTEDLKKWVNKKGDWAYEADLNSKKYVLLPDRDKDGKAEIKDIQIFGD